MMVITQTATLGVVAWEACKHLPFNSFMASPNETPGGGVGIMWHNDLIECQGFRSNERQFTLTIAPPTLPRLS